MALAAGLEGERGLKEGPGSDCPPSGLSGSRSASSRLPLLGPLARELHASLCLPGPPEDSGQVGVACAQSMVPRPGFA